MTEGGILRRSVRSPRHDRTERPFLVIWEATRACALACAHCRAEAIPHRSPFELSTAQAIDLMADVAAFGNPAPIFVITGGDPFERPDIFEIIEEGKSLGLTVAMSPSATSLLNPTSIQELVSRGLTSISLSLDGASASVHDAFRGIPGTFDRTIAAWRYARSQGLKVQINTTVTADNVGDLPAVAALVKSNGAMTWSAFLLVPTGRGSQLAAPSPAEIEDILNFLYDVGSVIPTRTTEGHHFRRVVIQRDELERQGLDHEVELKLGPLYRALREQADELGLLNADRVRRPPLNVSAGSGFVFVSHTGEVQPSGFLDVSAGNVKHESLATIYQESELFTGIRDLRNLRGRCGMCEFKQVCGGSRARAYASSGDIWADDPLCSYAPPAHPVECEVPSR